MLSATIAKDIEARARESGIRLTVLVKEAGLPFSTFSRMRSGSRSPKLETITKLQAALDRLIASKGGDE